MSTAAGWLALPDAEWSDVAVKPPPYLPVYEQLLWPLREESFTLLELGIWKGDSLEMWRDAFSKAIIVGVDLEVPELTLGPRVHAFAGGQDDPALMARIRDELAPAGFQVIIDDASHVGQLSARSLQALYLQHLRPGGLYIIEDWGTGYTHAWPDGADLASAVSVEVLAHSEKAYSEGAQAGESRLPSHDYGMVGLVKRLVDHSAAGTLGVHQPAMTGKTLPIEWMRVQDGLVILKRPDAAL